MIALFLQIWNKFSWQPKLIAAIILIILFIFGYQSCRNYLTQSDLERQLQIEKDARAIEHQEEIKEKAVEANKAENKAQESVNKVRKIENANFKNTNGKAADKSRCEAFPESEECR